jgi:hypothetical protein
MASTPLKCRSDHVSKCARSGLLDLDRNLAHLVRQIPEHQVRRYQRGVRFVRRHDFTRHSRLAVSFRRDPIGDVVLDGEESGRRIEVRDVEFDDILLDLELEGRRRMEAIEQRLASASDPPCHRIDHQRPLAVVAGHDRNLIGSVKDVALDAGADDERAAQLALVLAPVVLDHEIRAAVGGGERQVEFARQDAKLELLAGRGVEAVLESGLHNNLNRNHRPRGRPVVAAATHDVVGKAVEHAGAERGDGCRGIGSFEEHGIDSRRVVLDAQDQIERHVDDRAGPMLPQLEQHHRRQLAVERGARLERLGGGKLRAARQVDHDRRRARVADLDGRETEWLERQHELADRDGGGRGTDDIAVFVDGLDGYGGGAAARRLVEVHHRKRPVVMPVPASTRRPRAARADRSPRCEGRTASAARPSTSAPAGCAAETSSGRAAPSRCIEQSADRRRKSCPRRRPPRSREA